MRILISGSSGLIGSALYSEFRSRGDEVMRLVRRRYEPKPDEITWDPPAGHVDTDALEGIDVLIHLSGENIASGRWTNDKKARIRNSRVHGTALLCNVLTELAQPPKLLICASAVGYYGDRGNEFLDEESEPGNDFLAEVCRAWEAATIPASEAGIRVINLRLGAVLSNAGGMFPRMARPFRYLLGGTLGRGRQYLSWIAIEDVINAIRFLIHDTTLHGPINAVAPNPVTNEAFTKALAKAMHRPALWRIPAPLIRLLLGEMGDMILSSTRALPTKLLENGYEFQFTHIEDILHHMLEEP